MIDYKIRVIVKLSRGKLTVPAKVIKLLGIDGNEYMGLCVTSDGKIELTPLGTTVFPEGVL
jgi:bifunctional DNA-binding transcriptional regulator/antitoxin component of YhaV-PrlF toxin-antitoxin module